MGIEFEKGAAPGSGLTPIEALRYVTAELRTRGEVGLADLVNDATDRLRADQERLREAGNALDRALAKIKAEVEGLTVDQVPEPMLRRVIFQTYARAVWRAALVGVFRGK